MCQKLLIPRRMGGFSPLSYGSDLALWLDPSYGIYTDRAAAFSSQSLQCASNSTLQIAGQDFWVSVWVKINPTAPYQTIAAKTANYSSDSEWGLNVWGAGNPAARFGAFHVKNRTVEIFTAANAVPDATWTHLFAWVSVADGAIYIRANNGAVTSTALGAAITSNANALRVGMASNAYGGLEGELDSLMLGKPPTPIGDGTNGSLAYEISSYLFNAGSGRVSADVTAAQKTAWGGVSSYDYDGDNLDAWGANDLSVYVAGPTYTSGIASGLAGDGDVESLLTPRVGGNGTPPSYAARPIWTAGGGKPYHLFDGSNDSISFGDLAAWDRGTGNFTLCFAAKGGDDTDVLIAKDNYAGADNGILLYRSGGAVGYWDGAALISFGVDSGAASIYTVVRSGTGAGGVSVRRNGVEITTGTDARTLSNSKALVFGDSADAGHTLNGRLGDVVFVASALNSGQLAQLEAWAAARQAA